MTNESEASETTTHDVRPGQVWERLRDGQRITVTTVTRTKRSNVVWAAVALPGGKHAAKRASALRDGSAGYRLVGEAAEAAEAERPGGDLAAVVRAVWGAGHAPPDVYLLRYALAEGALAAVDGWAPRPVNGARVTAAVDLVRAACRTDGGGR